MRGKDGVKGSGYLFISDSDTDTSLTIEYGQVYSCFGAFRSDEVCQVFDALIKLVCLQYLFAKDLINEELGMDEGSLWHLCSDAV